MNDSEQALARIERLGHRLEIRRTKRGDDAEPPLLHRRCSIGTRGEH